MTDDRIKRAQQAISTVLPAKSEYIVDTNEFQEVKSRLAYVMHEHVPSDAGRPVLHRRTREDDNAGGLRKKWDSPLRSELMHRLSEIIPVEGTHWILRSGILALLRPFGRLFAPRQVGAANRVVAC